MSQQAIVEQVLQQALEKIGNDIGELLAQACVFGSVQLSLSDKSAYFSDLPRGKSVLTRITISGDQEGEGYAILPVSTAITLGGTLIMLPPDAIAEKAQSEKLAGEEADAFSEIANILVGSLSHVLQNRMPKPLHAAKGEQEELVPTKVELDSDTPFPPGSYMLCTSDCQLDGSSIGTLDLLFPATVLGLTPEAPTADAEPVAADTSAEAAAPAAEEPAAAAPSPPPTPPEAEPAAEPPVEDEVPAEPALTPEQVKRNKAIVDLILKTSVQKIDGELGALLGTFVGTSDLKLRFMQKDSYFFDEPRATMVLSSMDVSGERSGCGFIAATLKDAVFMGGTLIMLPEDEIQSQMDAESFEGEAADAYGEIANILTGIISTTFEQNHPKKHHFVRKDTVTVTPTKVDPDSDDPFPPGEYYVCSCSLTIDERELGTLDFIFPSQVLSITAQDVPTPQAKAAGPGAEKVAAKAAGTDAGVTRVAGGGAAAATTETAATAPAAAATAMEEAPASERPEVTLIVTDSPDDGTRIAAVVEEMGRTVRTLSFQDDIKGTLRSCRVPLIFLVMRKVSEQGFAAAIKIQSAQNPAPPLIAGGPDWTRSAVLRAVRYGAVDILVTPVDEGDIRSKLQALG